MEDSTAKELTAAVKGLTAAVNQLSNVGFKLEEVLQALDRLNATLKAGRSNDPRN